MTSIPLPDKLISSDDLQHPVFPMKVPIADAAFRTIRR
jgi:hypothetical protein